MYRQIHISVQERIEETPCSFYKACPTTGGEVVRQVTDRRIIVESVVVVQSPL